MIACLFLLFLVDFCLSYYLIDFLVLLMTDIARLFFVVRLVSKSGVSS